MQINVYHSITCIQTFKSQLRDPDYSGYDVRTKKFNFRDVSQPIRITVETTTKEWIMTVQEGEEGVSWIILKSMTLTH